MAGPQLALVLKAEKTANRASHQAAISQVNPSNKTTAHKDIYNDSQKENVEPSYMREIAPPRLRVIIQKQSFFGAKSKAYLELLRQQNGGINRRFIRHAIFYLSGECFCCRFPDDNNFMTRFKFKEF